MNYTTKQLADITNSKLIGNPFLIVKNISYDTRKIYAVQETAFIAINTTKNSGEKYIENAIEKGIKVIISENIISGLENVTWIIIKNSIEFLQNLAKYHLSKNSLKTIGITGSNGKTVIKEWLFQCLNEDFNIVKSPKSFNSQIGLPLSLLEIREENELGIFEVGISMPFEMEKQVDVFSPKIGILTNIGSAHSANFKSQDDLIHEKIKLFRNSEKIIYNGDNKLVKKRLIEVFSSKELVSFGLKASNDIHVSNDWENKNEPIKVKIFNEFLDLNIPVRNQANISNTLCIIALMKDLGFSNEKILEKISLLKPVEMRLESVLGERNNLVINDYFNLDLDSLVIAFQFIKEYQKDKKVLLLTDFLEGKDSKEGFYNKVASLTNQQNFNEIILIGEEITQFSELFSGEIYSFNSIQELIDSQVINKIENSLILLKGARKFAIEKIKTSLELQKHDTVLEVNLNAILHNIIIHQSLLNPKTKMMAMVKAFSYGLGGHEVAEFLQHHHIDYLGVAYADEGVNLRKKGITTPIVVMNPEQSSYPSIIDYGLEPEIYSFRVLDSFYNTFLEKGINKKYPVHIKLETGMHRLGFKEEEIDSLINKLKTLNVEVMSIFSHLSSADIKQEKEYTLKQIQTFKKISKKIISGIGYRPILHILNSSGIVNYPEYQFDMVRIGIGMVGVTSNPKIKKLLQNAVTFKSVISQISNVEIGESIGYSRKHTTEKNTKIATIPVGYADGIPRSVGNTVAKVGLKNQLFPVVGNICMDMMMIDIGDFEANEGDKVIIFNSNPSLEEFAEFCNTIPYEVLTSISSRVKRIYIKS